MIRLSCAVLMVLTGCWPVLVMAEGGIGSYSGEVSIDSKDGRVIVLVDTAKDGGRDGVVDQWFVLQSEEGVPPLAEHLENAQIVHTAESLRIVSHARRLLFDFVLRGERPSSDVPVNFKGTTVEGFGLAHYKGETAIRIATIRSEGRTAFTCEECGLIDSD